MDMTQRPLGVREKKVGLLIITTRLCTYPENLAKMGPIRF